MFSPTDSSARAGRASLALRARRKAWAILSLCRVSNLPTVWMNVLTAMILVDTPFSLPTYLVLCLSISCFYCGGMCLNDLLDREYDAIHRPERPIPSGKVDEGEAELACIILFTLAFLGLMGSPNPSSLLPGFALLGAIFAYDWFHKAQFLAVFLMGGTRALVYIVVGWAAADSVGGPVLIAGLVMFVYTIGLTVVARLEDAWGRPFSFPLIPRMIAGMPIADSLVLAYFASPLWLIAGPVFAGLTLYAQRSFRGD